MQGGPAGKGAGVCAPRPLWRQSSTAAGGSRGSSSERLQAPSGPPPGPRGGVLSSPRSHLHSGQGLAQGHRAIPGWTEPGLLASSVPGGPPAWSPKSAGRRARGSRGACQEAELLSSSRVVLSPLGTRPRAGPAPPPNYNSQEAARRGRGREAGSAAATLASHPAPSLQPLAASALWTEHGLPGGVVFRPGALRGGADAGTPTPGVPCAPDDVNGGRGRARPRGSGAQEGGVRREGEGAHTPPPPRRSFPLPRRKLGSLSPCVRHIGL